MIGGPGLAVAPGNPIFQTLAPGVGDAYLARPAAKPSAAQPSRAIPLRPNRRAARFVKMVHNGIEYGIMAAYARRAGSCCTARTSASDTQRNRRGNHAAASTNVIEFDLQLRDIYRSLAATAVSRPGCWTWPAGAALTEDTSAHQVRGPVSDSGEAAGRSRGGHRRRPSRQAVPRHGLPCQRAFHTRGERRVPVPACVGHAEFLSSPATENPP